MSYRHGVAEFDVAGNLNIYGGDHQCVTVPANSVDHFVGFVLSKLSDDDRRRALHREHDLRRAIP